MNDLRVYYSSLSSPHYVDCKCSRWDISDYSLTFETWLKKDDLSTIRDNIIPGATGELFNILGKPTFMDYTWDGNNTLKLTPLDVDSTLNEMRNEKIIYVKNISDSPIAGTSGYINVKIEGYISGAIL